MQFVRWGTVKVSLRKTSEDFGEARLNRFENLGGLMSAVIIITDSNGFC
ncbi:Uncharacterized protein dnm_025560 [Desulfonema magnum]|uniref:Uncharacterized protein n=1 Tax=Desulfonema magnum TaxID=45655 RepID=A0A975GM79_9BACT|nr:Uncharacterized protein dnm_025560 [Desulfonema magnum]